MASTTLSDFNATNPLATFTLGNSSWSGQVSTSGGQIVAGTADSGGGGYATFSAVDLSTAEASGSFIIKLVASIGGFRGSIKLTLKDSASGSATWTWNTASPHIKEFVNHSFVGYVGSNAIPSAEEPTAPYTAVRPTSDTLNWADVVRFDVECSPSAWGTSTAHFKLLSLSAHS